MFNNNPNNGRGGWNQQPQAGWGQQQPPYGYGTISMAERSSLAAKVMTFTFFSVLAAMAGTFVGTSLGLRFGVGGYILVMVAEIAMIFGLYAFREKMPINFILLYGFAAVTGLSISPLIGLMLANGQSGIVYQALGITAGLTLALSAYSWTTKRDFSGIGPYLFAGLIALLIVGFLGFIFPLGGLVYEIYLYAGTVLFSFYLIYDVQRVKKVQDTVGNAIMLSIGIYLDIFNLFLFILRLLSYFNRN